MPRLLSKRAALVATALLALLQPAAGRDDTRFLMPPEPRADLDVRIAFLPEDRAALEAAPAVGVERIAITGTYTSAERREPVGFVLRDGRVTNRFPNGPDGLLLIDAAGRASVHDVSNVEWGGRRFDLRDVEDNEPFLALAAEAGLSAVQTHLLIKDGALDLRDVEDAPRFRRRLLFETADGRIGVFATGPATLYDAAVALLEVAEPRMALNLDMGTFDFCERVSAESYESCGVVPREGLDKLTNVILITRGLER